MTDKADKTDEFTTEQATLLQPMTDKANKTKELTTELNKLLDPMSRKAAESELLTKELLKLLEPMTRKALASQELADEMMAQLANHIALAQEKVTMSEKKILRLTEDLVLMGKEITLEGKKITIERDRAELELQRATARLAVATALQFQLGLIRTAMETESTKEIEYINKIGGNEVAIKESHLAKVEAARYAAERADLAGQVSEVNRLATALTEHNNIMIYNTKTVKLTEKLIHLLA
jgi:hypothetical protein